MANSKAKGNKGERELCKWWQQWSGLEFSRVPASGGLRWQKTDNISGDIICTDERKSRRFPFSVESKNYRDIRFEHILLGNKKTKILEFWQQSNEDADRSGKLPILFMRYNGMPKRTWFVIIQPEVAEILFKHKKVWTNSTFAVNYITNQEGFLIMMSTDLQDINYTEFIKDVKIYKRHAING